MITLAALALIVAAIVVATQIGGSSSPKTAGSPTKSHQAGSKSSGSGAPVNRQQTTVAVLNGTTVPGLAAQVSDSLDKLGFKRGPVTNAADQQIPATKVQYAAGNRAAARSIAKALHIGAVLPLDAGTQALAGPSAMVVVTVGTDRTP